MNVGSTAAYRYPTPQAPAAAATPSDPAMGGMRMAAPVFRTYMDLKGARSVYRGARDYYGGFSNGAMRGGLSTVRGGMRSLPKVLGGSFVFSAIMSGITNLLEAFKGQKTPAQALGGFVADTAAYTGIGAAATMVGGFLGSLIPIPFVGTFLGLAAGTGISILLGNLYEKNMRTQLGQTCTTSIQSMMTQAATPAAPAAPPAA